MDDELEESGSPDDELLRNAVKNNNSGDGPSEGSKQAAELLAKEGGKAALEAYGVSPEIADKVVDKAANNPLVKKGIDMAAKKIDSNPAASAALNSSAGKSALDAASQATGNSTSSSDELSSESSEQESSSDEGGESDSSGSGIGLLGGSSGINPIVIKLALFLAPYFFVIIIIISIFNAVAAPVGAAWDYIKSIWDNTVGAFINWLFPDDHELEERYYKKLDSIKKDYDSSYNVCIDTNLITATLTINMDPEDFFKDTAFNKDDVVEEDDDEIEEDDDEVEEDNDEDSSDSGGTNYKKMTNQIKLLAKMQIKYVYYDWDSSQSSHCKDSGITSYDLVTQGDKDSSSARIVATHDSHGFFGLGAASSKERNYEYVLYRPVVDSDGKCDYELPESKYEISVGTFDTREDSVYYWNLIDQFIPVYYKDYINEHSDTEEEKNELIVKLADDIYSLYDSFEKVCEREEDVTYITSTLCPNGITAKVPKVENGQEVKDAEGNLVYVYETMPLEDYVAGVTSGESYDSENIEALKAQAVAARTYALNKTNMCADTMNGGQRYTHNVEPKAKQATLQTAGEYLVDQYGKIFSSEYDSFCYQDHNNRCPDSVKHPDGTYTVTYTKIPGNEKHVLTLDTPRLYGRIVKDTGKGQGHARGMSQLVSYQLAERGWDYRRILSYFYATGVQIVKFSPAAQSTTTATVARNSFASILASNNSSVEDVNEYIFTSVRSKGVSTRAGVVAAATALPTVLYEATGGYKIPYELGGKYKSYGIDGSWGTATGVAKYPNNGIDCSGFVSWAIHNGGFEYITKSAHNWKEAGNSRRWTGFDNTAQPGDLISFDTPGDGYTGHIIMIIGLSEDSYVVAESGSGYGGVVISNINYNKVLDNRIKFRDDVYLVNMDNYYSSATKVTDYPS